MMENDTDTDWSLLSQVWVAWGAGTRYPPARGAALHLQAGAVIRGHRSARGSVENAPPPKSRSLDHRHLGLGWPRLGPPGLQAPQAWGRALGAHSENSKRRGSQLYPNPSADQSDFYGWRIITHFMGFTNSSLFSPSP